MVVRRRPQRGHRFTESPVLQLALQGWRSRSVGLLLMLAFLILVGRSFYLQVINNDFLQEKGDSRYRRDIEVSASRGKITDRNGEMLAVSTPMKAVWAIPGDARTIPVPQKRQLATLLDMSLKELDGKIAPDKTFVYVKRQVPPETADRIAALNLSGVHEEKEYRRFYPTGDMTAHIVGFTGVDGKGLEGVELAFQNSLLGHAGSRSVIKDRRGQIVEDVGALKPPMDGKDIHLALDSKIQYLAYSHLKAAIESNNAKAGGAIVIDTRTGEILALANWPTYNPNNRQHLSGAQLRNRAITDTFEPGSVMKPFTAALALERGKFRFDSLINCAPGRITIGSATISDAHPHGVLTVAQVIQKSSNVGTVKMALEFPPKEMWEMFDSVGFGQPPNLGFPGEVTGRLRPWKSWRPIEQATMSYGHGISISLVQLARAYTVFARDGELVPLSLVRTEEDLVRGVRVFSPQTIREVRAMLEMAVQPEGTAPKARVPGYRVGGKTGTAYKVEGGVYAKKYVASFVGLAPISDPRLVVAVMIDEPSGGAHYGGDVAGPAFSQIMGGALRTLGIRPDAPIQVVEAVLEKERL
ncbi:MAG: cell division protein [Betaproteobacteria bacterium HGW-Betaproteobacteria-10]|nr:MAG: cell division protein [Betaproteobacteria bacterium HGW-Betaproteobacteria-10]